jgi:dTDP-4-dehydrorhamnose 3,5-epimerase-like enzyme
MASDISKVRFFHSSPFVNVDSRRSIFGVAGQLGIHLDISQIKIIEFSGKSVNDRLVVGNHRHLGSSDQWEFIIVLGDPGEQQFEFRYRNQGENIEREILSGGLIVAIPPGCSLGLVALRADAKIIEISNRIYDPANYEIDNLFEESLDD